MSRLEDRLLLNRFFHRRLGAECFDDLRSLLKTSDESSGDARGRLFDLLLSRPRREIDEGTLRRYEANIADHENALAAARNDFRGFRYFQHLALLYMEAFLDQLTSDPRALLSQLNGFLDEARTENPELADFPGFRPADLRRLAFFMATGSGKTLLLHVHVRQALHYLRHGDHPDALVRRSDGRREFDNILLITPPHAELSRQHLRELRESGMRASRFLEASPDRLRQPTVQVLEISKLCEEPTQDGVAVPVDAIGSHNLVLVDEGHKGAGSKGRIWKNRQKKLSENGFLLEYSATFAQAVAAASRRDRRELLGEYGKAILFDYSYPRFHADGYGKDFIVLNRSRSEGDDEAHETLLRGLLVFYHQLALYSANRGACGIRNIERPLWVLLGSRVNALYRRGGETRSDAGIAVGFLQRFLQDETWATEATRRILVGESDLFLAHVPSLRGSDPVELCRSIRQDVFHGHGALEVRRLRRSESELELRVSAGAKGAFRCFGVVNVGDATAFGKYLGDQLGITVQEDRFAASLFRGIDQADSPVHLLIGAKKFIEGWSSWRVCSMGLLNVGKSEGPQIMQLFGRGVRLKGENMSLKRLAATGLAATGRRSPREGV
ncbi:MAG: DEAD/DEAH box helicase family protein, partial [Planctomycetales bacterium]